MGVTAGFLLVSGLDPAQLVERLGMRTGEVVPEPDTRQPGQQPALGPVLDGWTLIVDQPFHLLGDDAVQSRLSDGATLVTLTLNETVMYSDASGHENGRQRWWVASGGDQRDWRRAWPRSKAPWWQRLVGGPPGPSKLEVTGDPPADLPRLLDDALQQETAALGQGMRVDYQFDIPSAVVLAATAGAFGGWPLDEAWTFRQLLPANPASPTKATDD